MFFKYFFTLYTGKFERNNNYLFKYSSLYIFSLFNFINRVERKKTITPSISVYLQQTRIVDS